MQLMDWSFILAIVLIVCATVLTVTAMKINPNVVEVLKHKEDEEEEDPFVMNFTENPNLRRKVNEEATSFEDDEVDLDNPEIDSGKW